MNTKIKSRREDENDSLITREQWCLWSSVSWQQLSVHAVRLKQSGWKQCDFPASLCNQKVDKWLRSNYDLCLGLDIMFRPIVQLSSVSYDRLYMSIWDTQYCLWLTYCIYRDCIYVPCNPSTSEFCCRVCQVAHFKKRTDFFKTSVGVRRDKMLTPLHLQDEWF